MPKVAIAAAHELVPGRYPDADTFDLFRSALTGLIARCPIRPEQVDGLLTCPSGGVAGFDPYVHERLISEFGLQPSLVETMNLGGATYLAMVELAAQAIRAGHASAVLCVAAGKFMKPGEGGGELMAKVTSDASLELPYGTFIPALYGLIASQYMHRRGVTERDLARVAVAARRWALLNPAARMRKAGPIAIEDVLASRPIASPFHLLDCSVPCDGGGAVLVASEELARAWTKQPAWVLGFGEYHARGTVSDAGTSDLSDTGARIAGEKAFTAAGLSPGDIRVAQLYDAFTSTPLMLLEDLGLCAPGEAPGLFHDGAADPGGRLPINTYGGLLSFGHTGDASGMSLLTAGALQTMGLAGPTQVPAADRVLVHAYGGIMFDHTTLILGREP